MSTPQSNKDANELRLFISSTFIDLQPEREQLIKKTFPRFRALCRERGVEFIEIDLRWGITDEQARSGEVIRICLDEINRCKPYFLGILGSRYGWIPGATEVDKDPELLRKYPWVRELAKKNKSIIEFEFDAGAISTKNQSAFFYEQQTSRIDPVQLDALRTSVERAGLPVRQFSHPEELGELVYNDLVSLLDRDWPNLHELTPLERTRLEHEAYARNRLQAYIASPATHDIYNAHIESGHGPLIVWGSSGLGKSALTAYCASERKKSQPQSFVIKYFVGASSNCTAEDVIRYVMSEIAERFGITEQIPSETTKLIEDFPLWLAKVPDDDPLILHIDAVNQLTGIGPEMHWLPQFIPPSVKVILSTTPELPLKQLRERGWKELELQPLNSIQVRAIANEYLEQYHKTLTPQQLEAIASRETARRPLFLRTMLEELRVHGEYESISARIEYYGSSKDEGELFQRMLERVEQDHGEKNVRSVMSAIWAARHGLLEIELLEFTKLTRLQLSTLLLAMDYQLLQREGLYTFFHSHLTAAVRERYLPSPIDERLTHAELARYFDEHAEGMRRREELPWQWEAAQDYEHLARSLEDPTMCLLFTQHDKGHEMVRYLLSLGEERASEVLRVAFDAAGKIDLHSQIEIAQIMRAGGYLTLSIASLSNTLKHLHPRVEPDTVLQLEMELGAAYIESANYKEAQPLYTTILERLHEKHPRSPLLFKALIDHSVILHGLSNYSEAEASIREALGLECDVSFLDRLEAEQNLAALLNAQGKSDDALEVIEEAEETARQKLGNLHPRKLDLSISKGSIQFNAERIHDAVITYEGLVGVLTVLFGPRHRLCFSCLTGLASSYSKLGRFEDSERILIELINQKEKLFGLYHFQTQITKMQLAYVWAKQDRISDAIQIYNECLPSMREQLGKNHPTVVQRETTLADLIAKQTMLT